MCSFTGSAGTAGVHAGKCLVKAGLLAADGGFWVVRFQVEDQGRWVRSWVLESQGFEPPRIYEDPQYTLPISLLLGKKAPSGLQGINLPIYVNHSAVQNSNYVCRYYGEANGEDN